MKHIKFLSLIVGATLMLGVTAGCQSNNVGTANQVTSVSSVPDDTSNINWTNEATITLGTTSTISGVGAKINGSDIIISKGGNYTITGTLTNGSITVMTEENVNLTLKDAHITNEDGPAIAISNAEKAYITLANGTTNSLTDGTAYANAEEGKAALFSNDSLVIQGNGSLEVNGNYKHGIASDDDLVITNGTIIATSTVTDGIHVNDAITIDGGNITVNSNTDGIDCEGSIVINNGTITANAVDDGIHADIDLTINGGDITIAESNEGIESKGLLTINDGNMNVTATDDGFNAGGGIVINNGSIYANVNADAIDSNAYININGGLILAFGGNSPECGIDCDQSNFTITGGTVIATGGSTSSPSITDSTQASVILSGPTVETLYRIEQDSANVLTFMPPKTATTLLFSSPNLTVGEDYAIYTGGEMTGESLFNTYYSDGTYTNGAESSTFNLSSMVTSIGGSTGMGGPGGGRNHSIPASEGMTPPTNEGTMRPEDAGTFAPPDAGMTPPDGITPPNGMIPPDGVTAPPNEGMTRPADEGTTRPENAGTTPPNGVAPSNEQTTTN